MPGNAPNPYQPPETVAEPAIRHESLWVDVGALIAWMALFVATLAVVFYYEPDLPPVYLLIALVLLGNTLIIVTIVHAVRRTNRSRWSLLRLFLLVWLLNVWWVGMYWSWRLWSGPTRPD